MCWGSAQGRRQGRGWRRLGRGWSVDRVTRSTLVGWSARDGGANGRIGAPVSAEHVGPPWLLTETMPRAMPAKAKAAVGEPWDGGPRCRRRRGWSAAAIVGGHGELLAFDRGSPVTLDGRRQSIGPAAGSCCWSGLSRSGHQSGFDLIRGLLLVSGAVAQLVRAPALQAGGQGFDPPSLHKVKTPPSGGVFHF